jgi:hypothetical protein
MVDDEPTTHKMPAKSVQSGDHAVDAADDDHDGGADGGDAAILMVQGNLVMLDRRVAEAFGVTTRELNQAASRNPQKFTQAHRFQLTVEERDFLKSQNVISKGRGGQGYLPHVYTQKGVARLATVLNTPAALEATDRMIDLCTEIYRQLAQGRTEVTIDQPNRHLPDRTWQEKYARLRDKVFDAVTDLLDTPINARTNATVRDEIAQLPGDLVGMFRAHLNAKGLDNEMTAAKTLLIIEEARALRDRTRADVAKTHAEADAIALGNLEKRLAIAEKAWALVEKMQPNAIAVLNRSFAEPRLLLQVPPLSLPSPDDSDRKN